MKKTVVPESILSDLFLMLASQTKRILENAYETAFTNLVYALKKLPANDYTIEVPGDSGVYTTVSIDDEFRATDRTIEIHSLRLSEIGVEPKIYINDTYRLERENIIDAITFLNKAGEILEQHQEEDE